MADDERGRSAWGTAELAVRLGLALVFVMFVLQFVLPPGRTSGALAWFACGMLAGLRRKPSVRQRVHALSVLVALWTVGFLTLFLLHDPRAAELSGSRLAALGLTTVLGGLLGSAAAFVGLMLTSGLPPRVQNARAPLGADALCVVLDAAEHGDGEGGRTGVVESAGRDVDAKWIGRRVVVLDPAAGDRVMVPTHGVMAIDPE